MSAPTATPADVQSPRLGKRSLANYFHPVAWSHEVEDAPVRVELLEEDLVLWRSNGAVVAMRDVCIHRGARLSLGKVTGDGSIQCPYHGWRYDAQGSCVEIPSLPPGKPIPAKARAVSYRAVERDGAVWVALDDPVADVPPFHGNQPDGPDWRMITGSKETWDASAPRMAENFNDWAHLPWVHTGLLAQPDEAITPEYTVERTELGLHHEVERFRQEGDAMVSVGVKYVFDVYFPFTCHLFRTGPGSTTNADETNLARAAFCPHSPHRTTLFTWLGRNYNLEPQADDGHREFDRMVFSQDRAVVESQRPKEIPLDLREELHLKVPDAWSLVYRPWLAQNLTDGESYLDP